MRTVSSYGVELRKQNIPIRQTLDIYRSAVSCLIEIYAQIWDELAVITEPKKRFNTAEHLVHTTKKNQARFDFDLRFPKMPSYLRRAAVQHALGSVSSYKTRLELWEKTDQKGGRPKLVCDNHAMPVFYRDVMYREDTEERDGAYLKLYDGHDWKWFRGSHRVCRRKPCRCDRFRVSGNKRKDIREKETEAASVEKKGYPEKM